MHEEFILYLKFKQLFRKKDYRGIMEIARSNQINLSLAQFYLSSIVASTFSIEYDENDIKKAREILADLKTITFEPPDEIT